MMTVSMDGVRINLVRAFNSFCSKELLSKLDDEEKEHLEKIRECIGSTLCIEHTGLKEFNLLWKEYPLNEIST